MNKANGRTKQKLIKLKLNIQQECSIRAKAERPSLTWSRDNVIPLPGWTPPLRQTPPGWLMPASGLGHPPLGWPQLCWGVTRGPARQRRHVQDSIWPLRLTDATWPSGLNNPLCHIGFLEGCLGLRPRPPPFCMKSAGASEAGCRWGL